MGDFWSCMQKEWITTNKRLNHKHDQDKSTGKHDQDKPQQIKSYPKEVDTKVELMSCRQNPATMY